MLRPPATVDLHLALDVRRELQGEGDRAGRQLGLDAREELGEEALDSKRARGSRANACGLVLARDAESERAALFGRQPSSSAIRRMRSRVESARPGRSLSAYDTAPFETPASRAMSLIVTLRPGCGALAILGLYRLRSSR